MEALPLVPAATGGVQQATASLYIGDPVRGQITNDSSYVS